MLAMKWIIRRVRRSLKGRTKEYQAHKEKARDLVIARLAHFNAHPAYGFTYGRISIKNTKSRWGSCSKKGNLNFSYKLALIAPDLADYVIVHELCHIGEFNHSRAFWDLVAKAMPDWMERRKRMGDAVS